jgi:hypothetical protein
MYIVVLVVQLYMDINTYKTDAVLFILGPAEQTVLDLHGAVNASFARLTISNQRLYSFAQFDDRRQRRCHPPSIVPRVWNARCRSDGIGAAD